MKTSEIKNLLRYCIGKAQETITISTNTIGYNLEWNGNGWEPYCTSICPLAAVLLIRQPALSEKNYVENAFFTELLATETIKEVLGVQQEFIFDFYSGMQNVREQKSPGWEVGNYIYKRLNNVEA